MKQRLEEILVGDYDFTEKAAQELVDRMLIIIANEISPLEPRDTPRCEHEWCMTWPLEPEEYTCTKCGAQTLK